MSAILVQKGMGLPSVCRMNLRILRMAVVSFASEWSTPRSRSSSILGIAIQVYQQEFKTSMKHTHSLCSPISRPIKPACS